MASTPVDSVSESAPGMGGRVEGAPRESPVEVCPRLHAAIEMVGRRWSGAIVAALLRGPLFFRELGAAVPGVSDRLLSQRLRELEADGLVLRSVHNGPPARVSYELTEAGLALEPTFRELQIWALRPDAVDGAVTGE